MALLPVGLVSFGKRGSPIDAFVRFYVDKNRKARLLLGHDNEVDAMETKAVVGYLRVSTDEQALGPVAQREALNRWCRDTGCELVAVFEDLGISGGAPLDRRPGLMAAVAACGEHKANLLVAKRDRLARDTLAAAMLERLVERTGSRILAADGCGNGDGPEGLLMRRMVDAFAEYERALIRARTRVAMQVKKAKGELVGAVPYGFHLASDGVSLVPDEAEGAVVALVRELRAEGLSLRKIAARLTEKGLIPRAGGSWHHQTVANIAGAANG